MAASAGNLLGTKLEVGEEIKIREDAAVAASACNLLGTVLGVRE